MRIVQLGDPVLREQADYVRYFWRRLRRLRLRRLSRRMFRAMEAADGVGLAAPQIGVSLQCFVYDNGAGQRGFVVNPEVVPHRDAGRRRAVEGCLSSPGNYFPVERWSKVILSAVNQDGRLVLSTYDCQPGDIPLRLFTDVILQEALPFSALSSWLTEASLPMRVLDPIHVASSPPSQFSAVGRVGEAYVWVSYAEETMIIRAAAQTEGAVRAAVEELFAAVEGWGGQKEESAPVGFSGG